MSKIWNLKLLISMLSKKLKYEQLGEEFQFESVSDTDFSDIECLDLSDTLSNASLGKNLNKEV